MDDKHQDLLEQLAALKEAAKARPNNLEIQAGIEILEQLLKERRALQEKSQQERERRQQLCSQLCEYRENYQIQAEDLKATYQEMNCSIQEKQQIIARRNQLRGELEAIESTVHEAVAQVKASNSLRQKFKILWDFLQVVFFDESSVISPS
ncbi:MULTISPECIES: hypothetical protein [Cyanophyceae]|uniref:hypothetical protein n=1 Tax=Cyanophyceae TaxID=3028117 RepID=UPI00016DCEDA|nr:MULTISPECIES: hypothetical protein [Cyanophyceae]ACB00993.1 conserved hypothetical protein [Picosynechococcus sp. PCC 7002]SMH58420.1 hypothetical protein SAMN06272755_3173 [Picosynechococcus sp. OG1]SMQ86420.1 hypothetical protein SAMN06272774_3164 [Synechococcus sp. 7002]